MNDEWNSLNASNVCYLLFNECNYVCVCVWHQMFNKLCKSGING